MEIPLKQKWIWVLTLVKVEDSNSSETLSFDMRKMRDSNKKIYFDKLINDAIIKYENQEDQNE